MQLLLDIGNTCCKSAVLINGTLAHRQSVAVDDDPDLWIAQIPSVKVSAAWAVSVRDDKFNLRLAEAIQRRFLLQTKFVKVPKSACGVSTRYAPGLGTDRFMALIAAWQMYKNCCVVIDCGTAVTVDALDNQGIHWGGLIMPGLHLLRNSLYRGTYKLNPSSSFDQKLFAQDSSDAIYTGCYKMWEAGIRTAGKAMASQLGSSTFVCTGGDSERLCTVWQDAKYAPDLVLNGLMVYVLQTKVC